MNNLHSFGPGFGNLQEAASLDPSSVVDLSRPLARDWTLHGPVVWAIDAFPDDDETSYLRTAAALQSLFPQQPIHPVYVLSENTFSSESSSAFLRPALKPMAVKTLNRLLSHVHQLNLQKPRVLVHESGSRPASARKFLRYAHHVNAAVVALASPPRRGLAHWLTLGSFSETIVNHSETPILVTGPDLHLPRSRPRVIVYPMEFADGDGESVSMGFRQLLALARRLPAEIHFFHQGQAHARTREWILAAHADGVRAEIVSHPHATPASTSLPHALVEYVRRLNENSTVIAMAAQTSKVSRRLPGRLLGGQTRDVIRQSPCPVFIVGRSSLPSDVV